MFHKAQSTAMTEKDGTDLDGEKEKSAYSATNRPRPSKDFKAPAKRLAKGRSPTPAHLAQVIRYKTTFRNVIANVMRARRWKQTESEMDWDIYWCEREWMFEVFDYAQLESWQRVNHYRKEPGFPRGYFKWCCEIANELLERIYLVERRKSLLRFDRSRIKNDRELCRKDLLIKNIKRQKRNMEREKRIEEANKYDFCPTTFVLPSEYALFAEEFKKSTGNTTWIMKPIGRSQGKGIFLFQKLNQISKWRSETRWKPENSEVESYVVQRYICNPYLIGGKKFDIRIYVLVTSFAPLTVYLYRSGFARFSNTRYTDSDMTNQFVHLTNIAIQKTAGNYNKSTGCKWGLRELKLHLMTVHGVERVEALFQEIQGLVTRSLISVQKIMINDKHCFALYGYDVMIDTELKAWLIEVNASPSLSSNTKEDYRLKFGMLTHTLDVIDMERARSGEETQIGGFDLIYKGGEITDRDGTIVQTKLGCKVEEDSTPLEKKKPRAAKVANKKKDKVSKGSKSRRNAE